MKSILALFILFASTQVFAAAQLACGTSHTDIKQFFMQNGSQAQLVLKDGRIATIGYNASKISIQVAELDEKPLNLVSSSGAQIKKKNGYVTITGSVTHTDYMELNPQGLRAMVTCFGQSYDQ